MFIKALNKVARVLAEIGAISLFALMLLVGGDVFMRFFFNAPIPGTLELSEFSMVVVTFLCFTYTAAQRRHIRTTAVVDRLPSAYKFAAEILCVFLMLVFLSLVIWQTFIEGVRSLQTAEYSQGLLRIPIYPAKLLIPSALFFGWLYFLGNFFLLIRQRRVD